MIDFEGLTLKPEKVIGCSDIKSFSTGSMSCDWVYGFDIYCEGMVIPCMIDRPRSYGYAGGVTRDEYKNMVKEKRNQLLNLINSYKG